MDGRVIKIMARRLIDDGISTDRMRTNGPRNNELGIME